MFREPPPSQLTRTFPASSTPRQVPWDPGFGACTSSISSKTIRQPDGNSTLSFFSSSLVGNFMTLLLPAWTGQTALSNPLYGFLPAHGVGQGLLKDVHREMEMPVSVCQHLVISFRRFPQRMSVRHQVYHRGKVYRLPAADGEDLHRKLPLAVVNRISFVTVQILFILFRNFPYQHRCVFFRIRFNRSMGPE